MDVAATGTAYPVGNAARTAVLSVNPGASVVYVSGLDDYTNVNAHILNGTNVAGYCSRGANSALSNEYSRRPDYVVWGGLSIQLSLSIDNGTEGQGSVYQWFSNIGLEEPLIRIMRIPRWERPVTATSLLNLAQPSLGIISGFGSREGILRSAPGIH